jgi:hypothetical protein
MQKNSRNVFQIFFSVFSKKKSCTLGEWKINVEVGRESFIHECLRPMILGTQYIFNTHIGITKKKQYTCFTDVGPHDRVTYFKYAGTRHLSCHRTKRKENTPFYFSINFN